MPVPGTNTSSMTVHWPTFSMRDGVSAYSYVCMYAYVYVRVHVWVDVCISYPTASIVKQLFNRCLAYYSIAYLQSDLSVCA